MLDEILRDKFELPAADYSRASALAKRDGVSLDRALTKLGIVEEELMQPVVAEALGISLYSDLNDQSVDMAILEHLSIGFCQSMEILPLRGDGPDVCFATSHPTSHGLKEELEFHLERAVALVIAPAQKIRERLGQISRNADQESHDNEAGLVEPDTPEAEGPVIRFVSEVFEDAVVKGASDIHFEVQETCLRIRFRHAGILAPQSVDNRLSVAAILARVKVMAGLNVAERRLPQDGRITANIAGRKVDFRVSTIPTSFGESIVCRVLDPRALRLGWNKLGFEPSLVNEIIATVEQPSGLFLVTGPTGSGKTTTLYTALSHLNTDGRKILTVEDPVEYNLAGIEQVQVHEEVGLTFARTLRAFLRQDPNIIMVGEIRDQETAEIACRSALVGRLVLSTLHTNTPEGARTRLMDLGVPEYIVSEVLRGVLGQTLVPTSDGKLRLQARLVR